jgi:homogentisate 1,2-dioxygenase
MTNVAEPTAVLYTRNGFAGPMATMTRPQYPPAYTRIAGNYAPRVLNLHSLDPQAFTDPRSLPVPVLRDDHLSLEVSYRREPAPFGLRNVFADEIHVILGGAATLETDFGVLTVAKDDLVLIPRATTYRFSGIEGELREFILASQAELTFAMAVGLGPLTRAEGPQPYADSSLRRGEFETVLRHGDEFTSVFTDYDPLSTISTDGTQLVTKINIHDVRSIDMGSGLLLPPLLFEDSGTHTMIYDLSARKGDRPPVHVNADYDECIFFLDGPGKWGAVDTPGTITHTPKGFPHQGPVENVPEGYRAILIETRSRLGVTAAGHEIAQLAETDQYSVHPSESQRVH